MAFNSKVLVFLGIALVLANLISGSQSLQPLVETGVSALSPDGKHVSVNVPAFFNMVLDTRGPGKGLRMSQSILSGLVKISLDRELGSTGKMRGPIKVSVGGLTMYDNDEPALQS